jgi:hypothetical protein
MICAADNSEIQVRRWINFLKLLFAGNKSITVLQELSVVRTGGTVVCTKLQRQDGEK